MPLGQSIYRLGVSLKDPTTYAGISMILDLAARVTGHTTPDNAVELLAMALQGIGGLAMMVLTSNPKPAGGGHAGE